MRFEDPGDRCALDDAATGWESTFALGWGREVVLLDCWEDDRLRWKVTVLAHEPYYRARDESNA